MTEQSLDTPPFTDSRRLFGPSLWLDAHGVVLETAAPAESVETLVASWRTTVTRLASALGWPPVHCTATYRSGHLTLAFTAPSDVLLTATEVNEWAWLAATSSDGAQLSPPLLSPGDLPRDEDAAIRQLAVLAAIEARETCDDLASVAPENLRVALVTGSNGKTTTTRLIAAMTAAHGWRTGWSCTDGVFINGQPVEHGDWSGPAGARLVVGDAAIQAAVLETARGGILRRGLGVVGADVAVVTNIEADHFGEYGVASLADLAAVKLVVAKGLRANGTLVLNADDAELRGAALPAQTRVRWFSSAGHAPKQGERVVAAWREGDRLILENAGGRHDLGDLKAMPLTASGAATYNIANALAASLAASELGVSAETIAATLATFGDRHDDNAGRLSRFVFDGITVLVDYAHNPTGLTGLLAVAQSLNPKRLLLLLGQAGNRGDDAIAALASAAWAVRPDHIVIKELDGFRRGREVGEVPGLLRSELLRLGAEPDQLGTAVDEISGVEEALRWARGGDVLVLPVHGLEARAKVIALLEAKRARR